MKSKFKQKSLVSKVKLFKQQMVCDAVIVGFVTGVIPIWVQMTVIPITECVSSTDKNSENPFNY